MNPTILSDLEVLVGVLARESRPPLEESYYDRFVRSGNRAAILMHLRFALSHVDVDLDAHERAACERLFVVVTQLSRSDLETLVRVYAA